MITPQKAYKKITSETNRLIAPKAYDYKEYWVFVGGENKVVLGNWPIAIKKQDGKGKLLVGPECVKFYRAVTGSALRVVTIKEDNK